jgi:murein DD-endopeptidase MepM/ murein hydrolase activator NlpD
MRQTLLQVQGFWRYFCGIFSFADFIVRPMAALFAAAGGLVLRSARSLDRAVDDRAAIWRGRTRLPGRPAAALAFVAAVVLLLSYSLLGTGLEVFIDGESIGYINNESEFTRALQEVEARASEILGRPYSVAPDVRYRFGTVNRRLIFNHEEVVNQLFGQIEDIDRLHVLTLDGAVVAAVENPQAIEAVLDKLMEAYALPSNNFTMSFAEEIRIERKWVDTNLLTGETELEALLTGNRRAERTDVLAAGETIAVVAARNGLSEDDLMALNAHATHNIGDTLVVSEAMPMLRVMVTERVVYIENIAYETEFVPDLTMYQDETKELNPGKDGTMRVTAEITYQNGREVGFTVVDQYETTTPITRFVASGQMTRPTYIKPVNGTFSSGFGIRNLRGVRDNHTGVDWSAPRGTPIRASAGGTVIWAGTRGTGYGRYVIIDHGKHITTLYAHCDRILVRVGQVVRQGEQIATVGSTGRSFGYHLHFEFRIDRVAVNPLNYVSR